MNQGRAGGASSVWEGVDRLVDAAPDVAGLLAHGLAPFAARRWRSLGRPVPPEVANAERFGAVVALTAPVLLGHVRAACDGTIVLFKGPEVAARYPDPALRPYGDLDLLVPDPARAQRQLLEAGFEEVGDPRRYVPGGPHVRPLQRPGLPLLVEIHRRPNLPSEIAPPPTDELIRLAGPSALGVDGVLGLPPAEHALVLAAHAWMHGPVAGLRDLVDVLVVADGVPPDELRALARRWGAGRLWDKTVRMAEALLYGGRAPPALRLWARNLSGVRERTVLEAHVASLLAGFSAFPPGQALRAVSRQLGDDLRPKSGEGWASKLRRSRKAFRHAFVVKSQHDEAIDPLTEGGARLPPRRSDG